MEMAENYQERSRKLVRRFLQTAVVVDDKAYMASEQGEGPKRKVVSPTRIQKTSDRDDQVPVSRRSQHSLNAGSVVDSFSKLGVICGVVSPQGLAPETMRKADIVILDWFLRDRDPQHTLSLLKNLLAGEPDQHSLRLVSIYTGEAQLETVSAAIVEKLTEAKFDPKQDNAGTTISYRHGRVVIYAKSNVGLAEPLKGRSVAEKDLPEKLVEDFTEMTSGLLPRIALTSLAAVREGEHKVLDRFGAELDPAFLAHRACLPNPADAERQIVSHVAEELRGLMDNAVSETSSQDADAVEHWITNKAEKLKESGKFKFDIKNDIKKLNTKQTIILATQGLKKSELTNGYFQALSAGFSDSNTANLDEQLAWIMSFRTVYNAPSPTLWLGSVVTELSDKGERHLICMRPRCDCVRLTEETLFFFLPLYEPGKTKQQIVVKLDDKFKRLGIEFDSSGWVCQKFKPLPEHEAVIATPQNDGRFEFTDSCNKRYVWRGELKAEYAQRIAQSFAERLSRVAVDESEWLRRMARTNG